MLSFPYWESSVFILDSDHIGSPNCLLVLRETTTIPWWALLMWMEGSGQFHQSFIMIIPYCYNTEWGSKVNRLDWCCPASPQCPRGLTRVMWYHTARQLPTRELQKTLRETSHWDQQESQKNERREGRRAQQSIQWQQEVEIQTNWRWLEQKGGVATKTTQAENRHHKLSPKGNLLLSL